MNQMLKKFASKKIYPLSRITYPLELKTFAITVHSLPVSHKGFIKFQIGVREKSMLNNYIKRFKIMFFLKFFGFESLQ